MGRKDLREYIERLEEDEFVRIEKEIDWNL